MPQSPPRLSFRSILFAIAILGTIPALAFSVILLQRYAESERDRAERTLMESAKGIARSIDGEFTAAEAALQALRRSPALDRGDLAGFERQLRAASEGSGREYALIDGEGHVAVSTFETPWQAIPGGNSEIWARAFRDGRTVISDVLRDEQSGRWLAAIGIPVTQHGKIRWFLVSVLFASDFARVLDEPGVPEDWIVSIVDRAGRHLVRSHNNNQFAGKPLVPVLVEYMRRGGSGTLRTVSLEGTPLISTVQYAPRSQWAAAVGLPVETLEAPMRASLRNLALSGFLLTAAALAAAFVVARLLDRQMTGLNAAAAALGRGEPVDPPKSSVKEVAAVGQALGRAARELNALTAGLEAQVAERTAALSKANDDLVDEMQKRRESEAQVVQMQKMEAVGQLTGGIAHDFNNMLAVILGSLQLLRRRLARGEMDVEKYIAGAVQGAQRAASLTARLLAFSRQQALSPEVVDADKLLSGMGEMLRRTIPESIRIEMVRTDGLWLTHVDAQGLESAIINLVANARDAMPDGGKLTLETANAVLDDAYAATHAEVRPGQYVMIAVADTGAGMAPEVAARVFDPFFTTKPAGQGTGLGLSQVHGFIKQSGGHVAIYSEPGQGTTVKLYLARHAAGGTDAERRQAEASLVPRARNAETILVVEDDADVRRLTVDMLRELGYRTLEADGGEAALALLDTHREIAMLFTDVVMPGMNGRQLAAAAGERRPGIAVLFTTGYTRNAIVHHGILDQDVNVIGKPHTLEALALKVSEVLYRDAAPQAG